MTRLTEMHELSAKDPLPAAAHFNWLVMGTPINQAMLLGDAAIPSPDELRATAEAAVDVFLAAYAKSR